MVIFLIFGLFFITMVTGICDIVIDNGWLWTKRFYAVIGVTILASIVSLLLFFDLSATSIDHSMRLALLILLVIPLVNNSIYLYRLLNAPRS